MGQMRPSMQELIRQRRRAGFVGRGEERAAFRTNLDLPPEDERHRFLFHVHGNAGVGKTFLVRELDHIAREKGALTAHLDENVGSVPEAMAAISRQLGAQGCRFKELDRLLAAHRERRHEAEVAAVATPDPDAGEPSAGSLAVARAGLAGLGMVPGVGAFAGVLDPAQLAQGADRLRAGLSARFRSLEDVQLVLAPEQVLTPVLLNELTDAADTAPWIVLFFDTYERTGPFLDGWLHEVMTGGRYGSLPATLVVVTAGQRPFDTTRWGAFADFMTDVPLRPFTEAEARGLLAGKGVVSEPVVEEVLRLTGGLPVLVSTLAEQRPTDPDDIGDPSATAVERFLKWEQDPVRRSAALACALPRHLDMDVFRAAVDCPDDEADALFAWLRALPFVDDRGDRLRYHDLVREAMLRMQRGRSPRGWARQHACLARKFGEWRAESAADREEQELWADEEWRELRLAESYHLLCAQPRATLPVVLRDFMKACDTDDVTAALWARTLLDAGRDGDTEAVSRWGSDLSGTLAEGGVIVALGRLLSRAGFDEQTQACALVIRGAALRRVGALQEALREYDRAIALDDGFARAYRGRSYVRGEAGDYEAALGDLDRALALAPDHASAHSVRGEYHRVLNHVDEALGDLDKGIELDPTHHFAWASRGAVHLARGQLDAAQADLDRSLDLNPDYTWALVRRARVWRGLGDPARQLADLDRAVTLQPDWPWGRCERGDALRNAGRVEESLRDYDHVLALRPDYASAHASRGAALLQLGHHEEALTALNRALDLNPAYTWALCRRAETHLARTAFDLALADADRACELSPDDGTARAVRERVRGAVG
ncbi:tetratricopeptide repeat protein [Streptomyces sp. NBC_00285]|uniref:tetratricopeptide repeat protein n=1 Tax=Streptomyces sp. NBC_00285 TaxID=2975700 RepID=UPI0032478A0D